ncbi:MAG: UDP-glucose--hexose-1-phosphate uridylyltransferase [Ruminococcaceae bacterium]|nr:UDP-glucose--hexose-1-phosphate uridylyltransferase [Oscillospiraceae bacterium]
MISLAVQRLIDYGVRTNLITADDVYVVRNRLMEVLGLSEWEDCSAGSAGMSVDEVLCPLVEYAVERGIIPDTQGSRDLFDTRLMGILTPMPREIIHAFEQAYEESPEAATDFYYRFSRDVNYVRAGRIEKDLKWTYDSEYGILDITINRSKPEKDPRDIAAAGAAKSASYPKCQLCIENAGFAGHATHPARQNLCPIPITVGGEKWALQYSPYGYYNEHCIAFNASHTPMQIDAAVFGKLLDIVDYLPHYFVGSNADLPIVGGSILSHEHFQGGKYTFAMETAPIEREFKMSDYPSVSAGVVKWPMSVVRLSSADRAELALAANHVLEAWRAYSDPAVNIFAELDGVKHSTVTPIARKSGEEYQLDLVLRNNITTADRPLGLFHPAPELHHIKKENIGLIEVMGLAVLPARLANEIVELESAMLSGKNISEIPSIASHAEWADEVLSSHPEFAPDNAREILEAEIGKVFEKVLIDAGVFKRDDEGKAAFMRFVNAL